jgi:hypothetical protein
MELRQKAKAVFARDYFLQMLFSFLPNACAYLNDWQMHLHCYLFERTKDASQK